LRLSQEKGSRKDQERRKLERKLERGSKREGECEV
jgi:hypothetical protein